MLGIYNACQWLNRQKLGRIITFIQSKTFPAMEPFRGAHSLYPQQYMFTVSNPSHELVTPDQYTQLVSTISQYQLIPGFASQSIDDPWDVVVRLLPYSKNTILDVTLPYVPLTKNEEGSKYHDNRTIGRYIMYKQQVIGIRVLTTSSKAPVPQDNTKTNHPNPLIQQRFKCRKQAIPNKLENYYMQKEIREYENFITVGDFYLVTSKFKLALLFLSQIKSVAIIDPYIMIGCEVVSIVNDQQIDYDTFINYYLKEDYHDSFIEGNRTLLIDLRKKCWLSNIILLYAGCKTSPSLGKVYFTRSLIEYGLDVDTTPEKRCIQTEDVQFFPLIDLTQSKNFLAEPESNINRLNAYKKFDLRKHRAQSHRSIQTLSSTMNQQLQLQPLVIDPRRFQIRPLSKQSLYKLQEMDQMDYSYQRKKLFNLAQLSSRSMIRCMYVFNMMNLFIFSKPKQLQSPFLIGVPFTQKTKNLFDILVYIFDNIKNYEAQAPDLEQDLKLQNILQLYRYKDQRNTQHDYSVEEKMLKEISGMKDAWIPQIQMLINFHNKKKPFYICSDDPQEKKKLKILCKEALIETIFVDVLTIDQFSLPLEIKSTNQPEIDSVLELEKYHNVLESHVLKLREMPSPQELNSMKQKDLRKAEYPPIYNKICQQLQKKHFLSIHEALRWIIVQKELAYNEKNSKMMNDLIINDLGKKMRSNIKTLSQISKFFIVNSQEQIIRKVAQISQEITDQKNGSMKLNNSLKSLPQNSKIINLQEDQQQQKENNNTTNVRASQQNGQTKKSEQKSPQQLYLLRLQKCRRLKAQRNKGTIIKCHKCQTQMDKKLLQKCKKCSEMLCLSCIEEISGLSGWKATQELYKFCPVCSRLCECEKCKKKIEKLIGGSASLKPREQPTISQELKKSLMEDENNNKKQPQTSNKKPDPLSNTTQLLLKNLSLQPNQQTPPLIKRCQRCQILTPNQRRNLSIQCMQCGAHECYFCVQQKYKQTRYKQATIKTFYKNWKCELCDTQWQKFIENKLKESQLLEKQKAQQGQVDAMNKDQMDIEVNSNHTSHYANDNMEIPGLGEMHSDPRPNFLNRKRRSNMEVQGQAHRQRKDSFSDVNFVISHTEPNLEQKNSQYAPFFKEVQKAPIKSSPYAQLNPKKVIIPQKYPLPSPQSPVQQKQSSLPLITIHQVKKSDKPQSQLKKPHKTSSESGYQSQNNKRKDQGASSVQITFRQKSQKQQKTNKGGPLWPNRNKNNKRSSSRSGSKRSKSEGNDSLASFNPKKKGEGQNDRNEGKKKPNHVIDKKKQKRHRKQKEIRSQQSGMVGSSSSSSSNSSSSSSRSSSSSQSSKSRNQRSRSRKNDNNKKTNKKRNNSSSSSSRSSSKSNKRSSHRSRQRSMKFSQSNSGSEHKQRRSSAKRSDSGWNQRGGYSSSYRGRGGYRGRQAWGSSNYHSGGRDGGNNNSEDRGYNGWRGGVYERGGYNGSSSNWRDSNGKSDSSERFNNGSSYRGGYSSAYRGRGGYTNSSYNSNDRGSTWNNNRDNNNCSNNPSDTSQTYRSSRFYKQDPLNNDNENKKQQNKPTSGLLFVKERKQSQDDNIEY